MISKEVEVIQNQKRYGSNLRNENRRSKHSKNKTDLVESDGMLKGLLDKFKSNLNEKSYRR